MSELFPIVTLVRHEPVIRLWNETSHLIGCPERPFLPDLDTHALGPTVE